MSTASSKKSVIIHMLDILKQYTDENHRLSQKDIMEILFILNPMFTIFIVCLEPYNQISSFFITNRKVLSFDFLI